MVVITSHMDMDNITDLRLKLWQDPYSQLDDCVILKLALLVATLFFLALGMFLCLGIISFEYYGGNLEHRSILNQVSRQITSKI